MNKKEEIKFRCTPLEKAIIKKKADNCGQTLSGYSRAVALEKKMNYKLTAEELQAYNLLVTFTSNFILIGNYIKNKNPDLYKEIQITSDELKEVLKKFR